MRSRGHPACHLGTSFIVSPLLCVTETTGLSVIACRGSCSRSSCGIVKEVEQPKTGSRTEQNLPACATGQSLCLHACTYRHIFMYRCPRTGMVMASLCPAGTSVLAITSIHLESAPRSPDPAFHHLPLPSTRVRPLWQAGGLFLSRAVLEHSRAVPRCLSAPKGQHPKVVMSNHDKRSVIYLSDYEMITSQQPYSSLLHLRKQLPKTGRLYTQSVDCAFSD